MSCGGSFGFRCELVVSISGDHVIDCNGSSVMIVIMMVSVPGLL